MNKRINEKLIAPCGFYCGSCPSHIAGECAGCTQDEKVLKCYAYECAVKRGLRFCGQCSQFPCSTLLEKDNATILSAKWLRWKKTQKDQRGS